MQIFLEELLHRVALKHTANSDFTQIFKDTTSTLT